MEDKKPKDAFSEKQKVYISLLLAIIALISISAASYAWFTIADFTKVYSLSMEITSGTNLRFDLDAHSVFDDYVKSLNFKQISQRIKSEKGFDMSETPLEPVTTSDCKTFSLKDGKVVQSDSGAYLEFTLHFMATDDMIVHLTSDNTKDAKVKDGTLISSSNSDLPEAMRISFETDQGTLIYDPGMGATSKTAGKVKTFGLNPAGSMILSDDNVLFALKKDVDKTVLVHVWIEGTDPACTDKLRNADYSIRLRFVGTDENNNILDGSRR